MLTLTVCSQAEGLDWLNKRLVLMRHCSYLGESFYFGWVAVWGLNPDCRSEWKFRRLGEASTPGGVGVRAVPRLCIELCPGIYLKTEENHGKTSVRAEPRKWSKPNVIYVGHFKSSAHCACVASSMMQSFWFLRQLWAIFQSRTLCAYSQATWSLLCKKETWNGRRNWLESDLAQWPAIIH